MNLSSLKKNNSFDKLKKAVASTASGGGEKKSYVDDRVWQPEVDKAGNGYAVIRFLDSPAVDGEDGLPFVQVWSHAFQGPGGWYIENSLTTLGKNDPVSEYNTQLWNSGVEANKEIARKQKRKLTYVANILVVSDAKHPENEGKVFLFKFGKKIFDKINEKLNPQFEDEKPVNPFDFWKGANFKLKIRNVEGYRNYDKSEFDVQSALNDGDDAAIEKVWKSAYSLKEFVSADNFKSYDELKAKLNRVLGAGGAAAAVAPKIEDDELPWNEPKAAAPKAPAKKATAEDISVEDDDMSFFEQLAGE
jgi:hypothetical protein